MTTQEKLYKIISVEQWQMSQGQKFLILPDLDKEFIHLAMKDQVPKVLEKFWAGQTPVILQVDPQKLIGRLVKEKNPGGKTEYYHLYDGKIPLDAVWKP